MNTHSNDTGLVWFRRDLRIRDHAALHRALADCRRVYCAFIFDRDILDALPERADRRVEFIRESLVSVHEWLRGQGSGLIVMHDHAPSAIALLAQRLQVQTVFAARDYEPAAVQRDAEVSRRLQAQGARLQLLKDQVIFEESEVMTAAGTPFSVFTPYRNAWMRRLQALGDQAAPGTPLAALNVAADAATRLCAPPADWPAAQIPGALSQGPVQGVPDLRALGFEPTDLTERGVVPGESGAQALLADFSDRIGQYREARD